MSVAFTWFDPHEITAGLQILRRNLFPARAATALRRAARLGDARDFPVISWGSTVDLCDLMGFKEVVLVTS